MINSIKHRLFLTFGGLTALVCVLFTAVTWLFAAITEDEVLKHLLKVEAEYLQQEYEVTNKLKAPRVDYMQIYLSEQDLPPEIHQGFINNRYEKEFYAYGDNYHIEHLTTVDGQRFFITLNASKLEGLSALSNMIWTFILATSGLVLLLSLLAAWYLSNRSAKPMQKLSDQIGQYQYGESLPALPTKRRDEIGTLSRSFERAFQHISQLLEREIAFTRDVSHELRTPMTLIKNTVQLSRQQTLGNNEIELIEHASNDLEQTVDVLLALARQENLQFSPVKLTPVLEKCLLKIYHIHPHVSFKVDIKVGDQFTVMGNPHLLSLLCQNLINNAFYHSNSSTMLVTAKANRVTFENALDGAQSKPYYQGLGHGHYLVKRVVEEMNWQVETAKLDNTYRVTIHLGP